MSHQIAPRHSNAAFFLATPKMRKNETNCGKVSPGGWAPLELLLLHYADEEQLAATMESMLLGTPEGQAAL
jgi:hypothetical protein